MDDYTYNALTKYFNHLTNVGYFKQSEVNKLIILTFLQEMVEGSFEDLLTLEDFGNINKVLYCLFGNSCMTPYPSYFNTETRRLTYDQDMSY